MLQHLGISCCYKRQIPVRRWAVTHNKSWTIDRDTKSETDIQTKRDRFKETERETVYMHQLPHQEFPLWLCLWHLAFDWTHRLRRLDQYFPLHHPLNLWSLHLSYETDGTNIRANLVLCKIWLLAGLSMVLQNCVQIKYVLVGCDCVIQAGVFHLPIVSKTKCSQITLLFKVTLAWMCDILQKHEKYYWYRKDWNVIWHSIPFRAIWLYRIFLQTCIQPCEDRSRLLLFPLHHTEIYKVMEKNQWTLVCKN